MVSATVLTAQGSTSQRVALEILRAEVTRFPGATWPARLLMMATYRIVQSRLLATLGSTVVVGMGGFQIQLDLREMHDVRMYTRLRSAGLYEPETSRLLTHLVRRGDTFVDVGANNGYFTLLGAQLVGTPGRVIAIEPNPAAFRRLESNVRLNALGTRVECLPVAIGESPGKKTLFVSGFEDGWSSLHRDGSATKTITVPVCTLQEIIPPSPRLVVKMDIEGSEFAALRGMDSVIEQAEWIAVIIEWNRKFASRELFDLIRRSFEVRVIAPSSQGFELQQIEDWAIFRRTLMANLLCTRPGTSE